ncbi:thiolase domain-containing protein [Candidatus Microgenomates bacterium]|nr:thiolase domain-containing protein [Candidatus Microgenomates bacterium]
MNAVIGYYTTQFGELWEQSLFQLVEEAIHGALTSAKLDAGQIDAIFYGNMLAGVLDNNLHAPAKIAEIVGHHLPVFRVESACASGGMAFHLANQYLNAGAGKTVLAIGAEKMTDYSPEQTTRALAAAASGEEQEAGLTFPGLYAMMARSYLDEYNYTEENLAYVAHKNHFHGSLNKKAHFRKEISVASILKSAYVAHPLKVLDCSPISDGASAVVLSADAQLTKKHKHAQILSSEVATDSISLKHRKSLTEIYSSKLAAEKAFESAGISPTDINVAELHDCFTIAELFAMEAIGFWKPGEGGAQIKEQSTKFGSGSSLIVNTSGGLKAAGHPVGATGIKQIGELYLQLTGQADGRQVEKATYGLAQNVGGSGGTSVVSILGI